MSDFAKKLGVKVGSQSTPAVRLRRMLRVPTVKAARAIPDTPTEHRPFRTHDYSEPYFEEGTPGIDSSQLPMDVERYDGDEDKLNYLTPIKNPNEAHKPGT